MIALRMKELLLSSLYLVLFTSFASASCTFLSVDVDESTQVFYPHPASYSIRLTNTGPSPQTVTVASLCDADTFSCTFPDLPNPFVLTSAQSATVHMHVDTTRARAGAYSIGLQVSGGTAGNSCLEQRTLSLGILSNSSNESTANPSVEATLVPESTKTATPGDTMRYAIRVSNPTAESALVNIKSTEIEGNIFSSTTAVNPVQFQLPAGQTRVSDFSFTIPAGWPGGLQEFTILLTIVSPAGQIKAISLPVRVFVYSPRLYLQLAHAPYSGACVNAYPTNASYASFLIRNLGELTGPFTADVQVPPSIANAVTFTPSTFTLKQGEARSIDVTFTPTSATPTGSHYYTIRVKYLGLAAITYSGCVDVKPIYGVDAAATQEYTILRGQTNTIPIRVSNNGSATQNYSITFNPSPVQGMQLLIDPTHFPLSPAESRIVNVVVQADASTELGPIVVPLSVRASNITRLLPLHLFVASSNASGSSPLSIFAPASTDVFEGMAVQASVRVSNTGSKTLTGVELFAEGLPADWITIRTKPADIGAGKSRTYLLTFTIPANARQPGPRVFYLTAVSGLESVRVPMLIHIITPVRQLSYKVTDFTPVQAQGTVREIHVRLRVSNTGNTPATNIEASIPFATGYVVRTERPLHLAPGQSGEVDVIIEPTAAVASRDVFLKLQSEEGAQSTDSLKLPALEPIVSQPELWPRALAILLLLIAIAALIKREEIEQKLTDRY